MANPTIVSLAILKVNWDVQKVDYLENFVPLVAECIRTLPSDIVSLPELQKAVVQSFGIRLPQGSLDRILTRAKQRGYISLQHHAYVRNPEKLALLNFSKTRKHVLQMHESLVEKLRLFCKERHNVKWDSVQAERALQSFLNNNNFKLSQKQNGAALLVSKEAPESSKFLVGSFIQHLIDSEAEETSYIETLAKGHMLANAIFLPEPAQAQKRFHKTKIYFDTSFLIHLLGYSGSVRQEPRLELIDLLSSTGAELACFSHTLDEIHGIFYAISHKIAEGQRHELYGPSAEHLLNMGYSASDIMLFANHASKNLSALGIRIAEKPDYIKEHLIDESVLSQDLHDSYKNPQALQRDVDSVSAILRLREGKETPFLEECRAIFVTTNGFLVNTVNDFFYKEAPSGVISPCLTDYALMNLLWLKQPLRAPDLPWKRVIADCYAATEPDEHLWPLYFKEISKLEKDGKVSPDDYYILRYSIEAKTALMDLTLGRDTAFREGTVKDILSRVREKIQENVRQELTEAKSQKRQADEKAKELAERADLATRDLQSKIVTEQKRREKLKARAKRWSAYVFWVVKSIAVISLLAGSVYTFPFDLPPIQTALGKYVGAGIQLALAVLSTAGLIWGTALIGFLKKLEDRLAQLTERFLLRLLDVDQP